MQTASNRAGIEGQTKDPDITMPRTLERAALLWGVGGWVRLSSPSARPQVCLVHGLGGPSGSEESEIRGKRPLSSLNICTVYSSARGRSSAPKSLGFLSSVRLLGFPRLSHTAN